MTALIVILDIDAMDKLEKKPARAEFTHVIRVPRGMKSGTSSVMLLATLEDGTQVALETSLANFIGATRMLEGREHYDQANAKRLH